MGAQLSVNWSAVVHSSGDVQLGYAVTLADDGRTFVHATTAALAASTSGVIEGVPLLAGSPRQAIPIQQCGRIDAAYVPFGGAGNNTDFATLDSLGRIVRSPIQTTTSIGRFAKDGSVTLDLSLQHATFTPAQLPGVVLWLRADLGLMLDGSNNVQTWLDQSGNGNHVSQSTAGSRPPVSAAAIGGKDALNFASSKFLENTLTNLVTANSAYSVLVVAKNGSGALFTLRRGTQYSTSMFFGATTFVHGDGVNASANVSVSNTLAETQSGTNAFYSCHRYIGGANNPNIFLNGTQRSITSGGTVQATETGSQGFLVGTNPAPGNQFWNGLIAEVAVTSNAIATADRQNFENYAKSRYGL